ncbi:MAG: DNA topoisomerase VI subunit B [Euryarchaeota archaeon]|nr:DNA topoisomerase VI subunit B [Euryarchaeota archaeon]|tara:strand:+ start:1276 stop:3354 length:2079 start_codon:yes stop_codon:yes gene_type:complete
MSIAERMASNQKQIAISEFFEKNKHFLGFDTLPRAIITAVKEAVDNSLDACEEARILPDISIEIQRVPKAKDQLIFISKDNGPGIPQKSIENVFGKLLYGSRFHAIRQSRGQQGIGITGVVMYSQLTTGKQTYVKSKIASESTAVEVNLGIDTRKNKAVKHSQERVIWTEDGIPIEHGLMIRTQMKAKFQRGSQSIVQYLKMTSIVNPHANIRFKYINSEGELEINEFWKRATKNLPAPVKAIKPHPHGIHLGQLQRMLKDSEERKLTSFLRQNFSGVSSRAAKEVCKSASLSEGAKPKLLKTEQVNSLLEACTNVKFLPPPTNCLSPIEDLLIKKGLSKTIDSKFVTTLTRVPRVTSGNPYQIEVGLIYGGKMPADQQVQLLRFANRVPLMYQQGGCLLTQSISSVDWRQYGLEQAGGKGIPKGPATILVHLASTNVQFTSEAKEAVASNEDVMQEIRKALLEVGRNLRRHMKKKKKMAKAQEKFDLINDILPAIAEKASSLLNKPVPELSATISKIMNAVIMEQSTWWDKETKTTRIASKLYNYTSRARSYTILMNWPEKQGARMIDNERGGRKETMGLWAWKLETLQPGENTIIEFGLDNLEKGDWTETEVFYRGSAEIIGASKLDEKILEEMKIQNSNEILEEMEVIDDEIDETISNVASRAIMSNSIVDAVQKESFQTTLFDGSDEE